MFEGGAGARAGGDVLDRRAACRRCSLGRVLGAGIRSWITALAGLDRSVDDAERVALLEALERLKSAAAAAQAVVTADFVASQRAAQVAAGVRAEKVGQGIAAQVGLARRDSPHRGSRYVGLAQALVAELPHTMAALRAGDISEWRATVVARETACLDRADRLLADAELGPRLAELGDRQIEAAARKVAYRLDPQAFLAGPGGRTRTAGHPAAGAGHDVPADRVPAGRPGVAAKAALGGRPTGSGPPGDPRSRDQIMADTTLWSADHRTSRRGRVPVEVHLVMTDTTLLGGGDEPADLIGGGPIPAPAARDLIRDTDETVVGAPALHPPQRGGAGRDGVPAPGVPRPAAAVPRHP